MKEYEITGIYDRKGNRKEDDDAQGRIGRVVSVAPEEIIIGKSLFLECIVPGFLKSLITSPVKKLEHYCDGIKITTRNSIYVLKEVQVRSAI